MSEKNDRVWIGPVQIRVETLIEAVWNAVRDEKVHRDCLSGRHVELLSQAAEMVQARIWKTDREVIEIDRLRAVLTQIQESAEHDIKQGIVPDNNIVWQIEADARAALAR